MARAMGTTEAVFQVHGVHRALATALLHGLLLLAVLLLAHRVAPLARGVQALVQAYVPPTLTLAALTAHRAHRADARIVAVHPTAVAVLLPPIAEVLPLAAALTVAVAAADSAAVVVAAAVAAAEFAAVAAEDSLLVHSSQFIVHS